MLDLYGTYLRADLYRVSGAAMLQHMEYANHLVTGDEYGIELLPLAQRRSRR